MVNCHKHLSIYNFKKFLLISIYFYLIYHFEDKKDKIIIILIFNSHLLKFSGGSILPSFNKLFNNMYTTFIKEFTHTFVTLPDFIFFINSIRTLRFNLKENRDQIRDHYSTLLSKEQLVSQNNRFDEVELLVDLDSPYFSKIINSLLNSVDTADRFFDNHDYLINQSSNLNDASRNFMNCKTRLLQVLNIPSISYSNFGIYNRCSFESKFKIEWSFIDNSPVCYSIDHTKTLNDYKLPKK